ncbi:MAG: cryptochrome/photolyase family protein [Sphingopyxis sp.]|uniref:cryptochrome/photolyase family protein n=1 Tax=Sphingopyxis sp. TaxID=1908224 RepID=UPI003D80BE3B
MAVETLILLLGDQLSLDIASMRGADPATSVVLLAEVAAEADYVWHHRKKLAFVFSAMRHHAAALRAAGWTVDYVELDDPQNSGTLQGEVARALARHGAARVVVTEAGEWRLREAMAGWSAALGVPVELRADDRFFASEADFAAWADGRKALRMEYFYRAMRRTTGLLMEGGDPAGGRWNFDAENRKPASRDLLMPRPRRVAPDAITADVLAMVAARFPDRFGSLDDFWFAVTAAEAEAQFDAFVADALPRFGDYQDAMLAGEPWLYHSVIALYLNVGLLDARAVCWRVEAAWRAGNVPINAAEGFIRQILGWREYVRGIYWREGPDYARRNALEAHHPLPDFYWSADTHMACMRACIEQTRDTAYAHHIQRLMVTGNFALLAGIDPHAVHLWYLAVYADAYEWVELPNTVGMSQFADGGLLASKPYAASGAYIDRMSDYCAGCRYDVKAKAGAGACPFNRLYWPFLIRHQPRLAGNPRLSPMYRTLARWDAGRRAALVADGAECLRELGIGPD